MDKNLSDAEKKAKDMDWPERETPEQVEPEKDKIYVGKYIGTEERLNKKRGNIFNIHVFEDSNGKTFSLPPCTVLDRELDGLKGKNLMLKYFGMKEVEGVNPFHYWEVKEV